MSTNQKDDVSTSTLRSSDNIFVHQSISGTFIQPSKIGSIEEEADFVYIGHKKCSKCELIDAFEGTLRPGLPPPPVHKFANPSPLGLSGFALTTFVLSIYNTRAQGIHIPNVVVGAALFYGGIVQLIAGIWEIAVENIFGATALCSYGGFWLSFGAIHIPWFRILDAYENEERELQKALGFYLLGWCIFTYGLSVFTMKSMIMFFALFFLLATTFLLLSIGNFAGNKSIIKAGHVLATIVAFIAWYNDVTGLANKENSDLRPRSFQIPVLNMVYKRKNRHDFDEMIKNRVPWSQYYIKQYITQRRYSKL
ncbi:hypothetical protein KAFR_0H02995 [Kazachstania africana CBS 2517]|uniref:Ammonia transport outward protein 2 n=1 Tax=Kazachstania africana (strain ATCC 22294 / BCRC 22015 / CBS 2517 / CECT 1963 / NBRC 1671 / NRRL Y-8276) TaxID=1071382 RepID=H2AZF3_KAZAF|nr:hypothetical protein KAFR_0H02995 [Kazachstania africana CBS 2517]CCF59709.1 hypothetical protein KAFR_0H02995 [Kazachstania africana CBS 2517]